MKVLGLWATLRDVTPIFVGNSLFRRTDLILVFKVGVSRVRMGTDSLRVPIPRTTLHVARMNVPAE
jgi:hypothetical protein